MSLQSHIYCKPTRADASKQNMALTSWSGSVVRKRDIIIAKNYLTADEIDTLNRLVTIFLESAELRVKMRKDLTLPYWHDTVDKLLEDHDVPVLTNRGGHSHDEMVRYVTDAYAKFDARRKKSDAQKADTDDLAELEREILAIKHRKQ
ncbi:RhuM family protein [uncultured Selenomonas sp.]|uniref:RhuM family protein n=1 Tax=uncultured Selenomonas sp. TaxID=159275 RepID=UPI00338F74DC